MRIYRNRVWSGAILALAITCGMGATAEAQWLSISLPGTPLLEHLCENNRDAERLQEIWGKK